MRGPAAAHRGGVTDEELLAALDPDNELDVWAPIFVATIPWERRAVDRHLPRSIEAETPELVVELLVRAGFLRGRFSASMSPSEQAAALRQMWTPAVIRRIQDRVIRQHSANFDLRTLPGFARKALVHRTASLPKIPMWKREWPPLVLLEAELDAWQDQHGQGWPGRQLSLIHGTASTFLQSQVRSLELRTFGPVTR